MHNRCKRQPENQRIAGLSASGFAKPAWGKLTDYGNGVPHSRVLLWPGRIKTQSWSFDVEDNDQLRVVTYLCIRICVFVFMYLCICMHVYVFVYLYVCFCICVFLYVYLRSFDSEADQLRAGWPGGCSITDHAVPPRRPRMAQRHCPSCVFVFVYLCVCICICVFVFVYLYVCICFWWQHNGSRHPL